MFARLISAFVFLGLYLGFLAWYDGWGMDPLTTEEVDAFVAKVPASAFLDMRERLRTMGEEDDGNEFYMLNLNRYAYAEGEPAEGVPAAYQAYGSEVIGMVLANAGHPIYSGMFPEYLLAGASATAGWDEIILVRYRSRRDFISMVTSEAYLKIAEDRDSGIDYAEVTPTSAMINLVTPRFVVFVLVFLLAILADLTIRRLSTS